MAPKEKKVTFLPYILSLLLILAGYFVQFNQNGFQNPKEITYAIPNQSPADSDLPLTIEIATSQQWDDSDNHPDNPLGVQYDGIITNFGLENIRDWQIELDIPENVEIASAWNGNYRVDNKKLYVSPLPYNSLISTNKQATFGLVIYSKKPISFTNSIIKMKMYPSFLSSPMFYGLVIASVIWILFAISHLYIQIRTLKYIQKQKKDTKIIMQSMSTFANMIDAKDPYTKGHSTRVAIYASELARRMKLKPEEVDTLYYVALLHDCGKIGIPDAVLKKPEKLTDNEWNLIQSHTTLGSNVLINFTAIKGIRDGALYHHERFDGKGYPSGLKGMEIPLYARIICVADSYDAMSSNRCYREHMEKQMILHELKSNAGSQFDPSIVIHMVNMVNDGFTDLVQEKTQIYSTGIG